MQNYPRASNAAITGGYITFLAGLMLLISFTSPYWLESYERTNTEFKNMGLWRYCFHEFRYPNYQFDKLFDGCHNVFSEEFYVIREWLLPAWLLVTQAFVTLAFCFSYISLIVISMIAVRFPLKFVLENEWILSRFVSVCCFLTSAFLFLGVTIFTCSCWRRDWLQYPKFNHLSWSYALAAVSFLFHAIGALFFHLDAQANYGRRAEAHMLVEQMKPQVGSHHGLHRANYI